MSHGHRPYWWAKQNLKSSSLIQTEVSCETGLGNPSGHVMINLVIGLAFVTLIRDHLVQHWEDSNPLKIVTNRLLKNVFYVWTGVVVASRIFISAHFPHQCFLAIGFGYLCFNLGFRNGKSSWTNWRSHVLILVSLSFLLSALGVYLNLEQVFGFDPDWSIELARKFCKKVKSCNFQADQIGARIVVLLIILHSEKCNWEKMFILTTQLIFPIFLTIAKNVDTSE